MFYYLTYMMAKKSKNTTTKKKKTTKKKSTKKHSIKRYIFRFILIAFLLGCLFLGLLFGSVYLGFWEPIPDYYAIKNIKNANSSVVYSDDGMILGRIYAENRIDIKFKNIPTTAINALIATEDARFYQHDGIDQRSMLRVLVKSLLLRNKSAGGGSTLSQQLAKNLYPRKYYGVMTMPVCKIKEAIIASRLEKVYTKKEILRLYLNTVSFGENVYGIESASHRFFYKTAAKLKQEEAATLIGMLKAPSYYNPRLHKSRAIKRRNVVLKQMQKYDFLTEKEMQMLQKKPLVLHYHKASRTKGIAAYFREHLRVTVNEILRQYPKSDGSFYNIYRDDLRIRTTIDSKMQRYAEQATKVHMKKLQHLFYQHWSKKKPWDGKNTLLSDAKRRSQRYRKLKREGRSIEEINRLFSSKKEMKIFTWNGEKRANMSPMDSIRHYIQFLNTGFLAIEPNSGKIKVWIGGIDFTHFKYDHIMAKRQVGSVFKPIVYATALEEGISPYDYLSNERRTYRKYDNWSPRNADNRYDGHYSMEGALAESVNTIAVDLLLKAGIDNTIDMAENMGITSRLPKVPSLALGVADISLREMLQVYATLANRGKYVPSYYISRIEDSQGRVIVDLTPKSELSKQVIQPETADIINHMLQGVVKGGTGRSLRTVYGLKQPLAGKTGTTQSHADGWFIGYNSKLVAGAWVGGDDMRVHFRSLRLGQGASMALPIYGGFMQRLSNNKKYGSIAKANISQPNANILKQLDIPYFLPENSAKYAKEKGLTREERKAIRKARRKERKKRRKSIFQRFKNVFSKEK